MDTQKDEKMIKGITRRNFVKGGAIATIGLAAGGLITGCSSEASGTKGDEKAPSTAANGERKWSWETPPKQIPDSKIKETIESDIVIVGAGIAGVTAALRASELGAKVTVIEKTTNANGRGGGYAAYSSKVLQEAGIEPGDKHEMHREWIKRSGNRCNEKIVWEYLNRSEEVFNWLIDKSKGSLVFMPYLPRYVGPTYYEYTGCHMIMGQGEFEKNDYGITAPVHYMWKKAEEQGVKFYFESPAQQLVKDGDKVTGVITKDKKGYKKFIGKKAVVLATGDIAADKEMLEAYGGDLPNYSQLNNVYTPEGVNTGDGQKMGMWAGGHMEMGPFATALHLTRYAWYCFGFLHVNIEGNRFMNEDTWVQPKSIKILNQPGNVDYAYSIFDAKYLDELKGQIGIAGGQFWDDMVRFGDWTPDVTRDAIEGYIKDGNCFRANSLEELADQMGVNKTNFVDTVKKYNEMVKAGEDTEYFKRKEILTTIEKGPFYGLKFGPNLLIVPGGLEINESLEVLDDKKNPISGLYAIGNVSGGRYGVDYPLVLNGNSHGTAMTEGYLVVEKILG